VDMFGAPQPQKYGYGFASRTVNNKEVRGMGGGGAGSGVNKSRNVLGWELYGDCVEQLRPPWS
jgi:hypothetical protein